MSITEKGNSMNDRPMSLRYFTAARLDEPGAESLD